MRSVCVWTSDVETFSLLQLLSLSKESRGHNPPANISKEVKSDVITAVPSDQEISEKETNPSNADDKAEQPVEAMVEQPAEQPAEQPEQPADDDIEAQAESPEEAKLDGNLDTAMQAEAKVEGQGGQEGQESSGFAAFGQKMQWNCGQYMVNISLWFTARSVGWCLCICI